MARPGLFMVPEISAPMTAEERPANEDSTAERSGAALILSALGLNEAPARRNAALPEISSPAVFSEASRAPVPLVISTMKEDGEPSCSRATGMPA